MSAAHVGEQSGLVRVSTQWSMARMPLDSQSFSGLDDASSGSRRMRSAAPAGWPKCCFLPAVLVELDTEFHSPALSEVGTSISFEVGALMPSEMVAAPLDGLTRDSMSEAVKFGGSVEARRRAVWAASL